MIPPTSHSNKPTASTKTPSSTAFPQCGSESQNRVACHRHNLKPRRAFTLIECLATIALIAIVLPVSMNALSTALRAASHARNIAEASTLADSKLNELLIDGTWQNGNQSGDFGPDWPNYKWKCEYASRDYDVNEVMVSVTYLEGGIERTFRTTTLNYITDSTVGVTQ